MKKYFIVLFFILSVLVITGTGFIFAFTGPSQQPPLGLGNFWSLNTTKLNYTLGNVGVGTSTPGYSLSVAGGDIVTSGSLRGGTGLCIGSTCRTSLSPVPSGMILYFNLASCPTGWSEFVGTRGRYIVGLPSGGTLSGTAGTALSDKENRPVGQHTHSINDPGHNHSLYQTYTLLGLGGDDWQQTSANSAWHYDIQSGSAHTGISIDNAGTVAGTNAPYIELLVCQKN